MASPNSSASSSTTKSTLQTPVADKGAEENIAMTFGFMNCYNAFVASELIPPVMIGELDQIHHEDVEEMDISWKIAMAMFRAKKFTQQTGKNNWGVNMDKKVGFNKNKLRCYNRHKASHFACECTKPRVENMLGFKYYNTPMVYIQP